MILFSKEHPYWHVREVVLASTSAIESIELSYYQYSPQSMVDVRKNLDVSLEDFLKPTSVEFLMDECPSYSEVAIHSKVKLREGGIRHIPMIDMSTGSAAQLLKLKPILDDDFDRFSWFKSGRSYHGYGASLIDHEEWVAMMGKLLLANQIGMPPTVDPRWVGHRLIAGYSALRWTKNTGHYVDIPKRLVFFS